MAMTADGKISTANRAASSFGSPVDHRHLLELRAEADAVMAGARTVDLAPINMGPGPASYRRRRISRGLSEYNLRVIVSRSGTVNTSAEVFKHTFSPILVLTTKQAQRQKLHAIRQVATEVKVFSSNEINFRAAFRWLYRRWNVHHLLCEGGGELNDALFREDLIDELHLTICPLVFGGQAAPTIAEGTGAANLAAATRLQLHRKRRVGDELFLVFRRARFASLVIASWADARPSAPEATRYRKDGLEKP
jgi:riboflavin-specific deaminase-like protein